MKELIDRKEVIKHIGDCLDNNGYVDAKKFAKCMREILNMPYETKESISGKAIDKFTEILKACAIHVYTDNGDCIHVVDYDDVDILAKHVKGEQK